MAVHGPLRRWKRFFAAFACIDDAIEAADPDLSRDEFRCARAQLVEMLCDATDDKQAEGLCQVLDEVMAESLVTLQLVPAMPKILASTDLAKAVGALRKHDSERVRSLASGIFRGWRASVEDDLVRVRAAMDKLSALVPEKTAHGIRDAGSANMPSLPEAKTKKGASNILEPSPKKTVYVVGRDHANKANMEASRKVPQPPPKKTVYVVGRDHANKANMEASRKVPQPPPKKTTPVAGSSGGDHVGSCPDTRMESTKRKLREGYQEAEQAKRQRKIQMIQAPEMVRQRQKKMHPIMRVRSKVSCASSMAERRFLMSSLQRI